MSKERSDERNRFRSLGRRVVAALAVLIFFGFAATSQAASMTAVLDIASNVTQGAVEIILDDMGGSGQIRITLNVLPIPDIGDLRGIYGNIADDSLLPGLSISFGPDITDTEFDGNVDGRNFGHQARVSATNFCPCDFGAEIGTPGLVPDDIQSTTFILMHASEDLDLSLFAGQLFAVRLANVGLPDGKRISSAKLAGRLPQIPEPGTATLLGLGLVGLYLSGRANRLPR